MKPNYLIMYKTGQMETREELNETILHLVEIGVINLIYDIKKNKMKGMDEKGKISEITLKHIK